MSIVSHQIHAVELARIASSVLRPEFVNSYFSEEERVLASRSHEGSLKFLAGRLAAKEAIAKAISVPHGTSRDMLTFAVLQDDQRNPIIHLSNENRQLALDKGIRRWLISIAYTETIVVASVIATSGQ